MKHSSPYPLPSPVPGTTTPGLAVVIVCLPMTVGPGVTLAAARDGPGSMTGRASWCVEGPGSEYAPFAPIFDGPGVLEEREEAVGDSRRFLDMMIEDVQTWYQLGPRPIIAKSAVGDMRGSKPSSVGNQVPHYCHAKSRLFGRH